MLGNHCRIRCELCISCSMKLGQSLESMELEISAHFRCHRNVLCVFNMRCFTSLGLQLMSPQCMKVYFEAVHEMPKLRGLHILPLIFLSLLASNTRN
ncbi:hypothetical protein MPTK1_1g01890 [Marchantia polymorpha subsp. ruderalis]|uniref:Uncharacterized protein n=2 Tax=Marchantia polymorpha TaxID=3197 RepID=A0AAF6AKI8_MARPO|nr:hypothetical protein MARPO_0029s0057 [Marchantia polymorpha]BBM96958.1 hypothetical protein Mp_1g01890 [Marchantia polymorpha subsp. ruderalis]|eukprot:PTQ42524.1 hypothetical protein MARPO_0029s0057 [Marchantia polymorpha]